MDQLAVSVSVCEALLYLCICSSEMRLESVEAMSITAVLEDCVDQLAVLGKIMPSSHEGRPDAAEVSIDQELFKVERKISAFNPFMLRGLLDEYCLDYSPFKIEMLNS